MGPGFGCYALEGNFSGPYRSADFLLLPSSCAGGDPGLPESSATRPVASLLLSSCVQGSVA